MMEGGKYSAPTPPAKTEPFTCQKKPHPTQKKKKNNNNRRFSDEQITSLESIFKLETKLEPRKKLQLARELGLQPRQVAIWFQNRRARWNSKKIEQEYRVLKANYDNLNLRFESLKEENQSLLIQCQKLSDLLNKPHDDSRESKNLEGRSTESGSEDGDRNCKLKVNPSCLSEGMDHGLVMCSDDDERGNTGNLAQEEEPQLLYLDEQADVSIVPIEKRCNFNSSGLSDHSCGTSNWWDFWT